MILLVPTNYLLPQYLSFSLTNVSLLEILYLIFSKKLVSQSQSGSGSGSGSYSILSFTSLVIFYSLCQEMGELLVGREKLERDFEKVCWLIKEFSKEKVQLPASSSEEEEEDKEEEVERGVVRRNRNRRRRESLLKEFEKESCCICFEDEWYDEGEQGQQGIGSFRSRCFLTKCGHQGE